MRALIAAITFAIATPAATQAQDPSRPGESGDVPQTLKLLENRWVVALQKGDTAALSAILADTFVDTDEEGAQSDKGAVLAALGSGDLKMSSIKLADMRVHVYGSAAVVTGAAAQSGAYKGQPLAPNIVFTDTFVLDHGKWRPVASHRSAVH